MLHENEQFYQFCIFLWCTLGTIFIQLKAFVTNSIEANITLKNIEDAIDHENEPSRSKR